MKNLIIYSSLFALTACSGGLNPDSTNEVISKDDQTAAVSAEYPHKDFTKNNTFYKQWKALKKIHKSVPYVCKTEVGNLYLFSKKKDFLLPNPRADKKEPYPLIGLCDATGKVLLECEYEKIGNPGGIASGYMEVQRFGKCGLYDYQSQKLIQPDFEFLFPSKIAGYVAIGKRGNDFFKLYKDGRTVLITNPDEIPSYRTLGEKGNFDVNDFKIALWVSTFFMNEYPESLQYVDENNSALIFTPSYLAQLKVVPEYVNDIALDSYFGVESLVSKTETVKPRSKKVTSFLEYFHEIGSDGRGYEVESRHLVTIDSKNKVIDSKEISANNFSGREALTCEKQYRHVKFLNDSLIEVNNNISTEAEYGYEMMSAYSYYEISATGKITPIYPESYFEMASIVKLTDAHLKGCFSTWTGLDYDDPNYVEGGANTTLSNHLTQSDLEYMRNELYARHGLIFTDVKWKGIFSGKSWYKAVSTNVDKKLTPLEKTNLQFIKAWETKLREHEETFIQRQEIYVPEDY